jgi:peptide/nickel transport system substrate-binding protein
MKKVLIILVLCSLTFTLMAAGQSEVAEEVHSVITDMESPMLAARVAAGELPPVEERLPSNPVIVTGEEIGTYGGELYVATTSPISFNESLDLIGFEPPLWLDQQSNIEPNVFAAWEHTADFKVWTFTFREGMKWSDGDSFNAEDLMFWWDYEVNYTDLTSSIYMAEFNDVTVEMLDELTVQWTFNGDVYPNFEYTLATQFGYLGWFFHPAHYAKQFHPEFVSEDKLAELREENDVKTNKDLYRKMVSNWSVFRKNAGMPTIAPYELVQKTDEMSEWTRNPYYWKVDAEGRQLPYVDTLVFKGVSSDETLQGQVISGQSDFASWITKLSDYTVYKENEERGGFKTFLWQDATSSAVNYYFNQTVEDPIFRDLFQKDEFRQAMSIAINRDEINKVVYFGQADPVQFTVNKNDASFNEEWINSFAGYDPEKAGEMLDAIGATMGTDGLRTFQGKKLEFLIMYWTEEPETKTQITEMIKTQWKKVGVNLIIKPIDDRAAAMEALGNNTFHLTNWNGRALPFQWSTGFAYLPADQVSFGPAWGYYENPDPNSDTYELREKPPVWLQGLYDAMDEIRVTIDPVRKAELSAQLWAAQAEKVLVIGTVGYPPKPIIIRDNLMNIPEDAEWGDLWFHRYHPEVIFLK